MTPAFDYLVAHLEVEHRRAGYTINDDSPIVPEVSKSQAAYLLVAEMRTPRWLARAIGEE